MIELLIAGFDGRMGSAAIDMVRHHPNFHLAGVYSPYSDYAFLNEDPQYADLEVPVYHELAATKNAGAQVWIDFTVPAAAKENTLFALTNGIVPIVGTTGFTPEDIEEIKEVSKEKHVGGLIAPNFAIGAILMMEFAQKAAKYFPDVEIIELHHDRKLDAPSGTAIKTAEMIQKVRAAKVQGAAGEKETLPGARGADFDGMRIHSVRLPGLVAHQEVLFGSAGEGLKIRHDSFDRASFMKGVALAAEKLAGSETFFYGLENLL
ncbi:4-hydroxy-tetrahydrodipicolinate reductase [Enterococcus hirae]|jgi:4-hydroxy-tetrahydrodipicolinate reductase|nr:4-hydroxy-tetrahydrodipicolinate reductase [Enterococcaceae bacterium]MCI1919753.1 4-hydroxy-tetrahydrodipicolinate reductase [Enterococcaceae bacterium]MDM8213739.1 4-hydroxy-tetrahydrodipicolinate reductase [Enterococcus hirae]